MWGAVLEDHPFGPRYAVVHDLHRFWSGFIVPARGEEGRHDDLAQPVLNVSVLDDSDDMELTRFVHRVVDFRILRELRKRTPHVVRPRLQPTHVPAVEDHHRLLVFGIVTEPDSEAASTIDAVAGKLLDMSARRIRLPVVNIAKPS